jgi:hypothetical protein
LLAENPLASVNGNQNQSSDPESNDPNTKFSRIGVRLWHGMSTDGFLALLGRHRFRIHPMRWAMACIILLVSMNTFVFSLIAHLIWGRAIRKTDLVAPPIFVVGHWRSGTTLLHELLCLDKQHAFPSTYECFVPRHFMLTGSWLPRLLWFTLPQQRPMDAMPVGFEAPQEDEFALVSMGAPSPYYRMAFCNDPAPYEEFYSMKNAAIDDVARFDSALTYFFRALNYAKRKRLVVKSPTHTGRIAHLAKLFPGAKFIHISRNPSNQILSTMRLWKTLDPTQGFQFPKYDDQQLLDYCLHTFDLMYDGYFSQWDQIPAQDRCEVRFEDLLAHPEQQISNIYNALGLGECPGLLEKVANYFKVRADYAHREYTIDPEIDQRIKRACHTYLERYGYLDS